VKIKDLESTAAHAMDKKASCKFFANAQHIRPMTIDEFHQSDQTLLVLTRK
jgi:hypothetical protein